MDIRVSDLSCVGRMPGSKPALLEWLRREGVTLTSCGNRFVVRLSDLPEPERRAYAERQIAAAGLAAGMYDDAAHARLLEAAPTMREEALRRATVARFLVARQGRMGWSALAAATHAEFGAAGNSAPSLRRILDAVRGVDPINYAPALLPGHSRDGAPKATISPEAWAVFEGGLKAAFKTHRIMALYNDVAALASARGWAWPSYPTVMRRLKALPLAEQVAMRDDRNAAHKRLYQSQLRDFTGLRAMEWVVLDGRTADVWVTWTDGTAIRPTILGLVDQASGKVLGIEIARSENAQALAALERRVFGRFGAPDNLLTDNGAAFSGHIHAGRVAHKHRNKGNRRRDQEPPGLHLLMGFALHFALPKNAQAKLMERKFADMSREIDTCPEFAGAHAGSHPGERPDSTAVPVPLATFEAVYLKRIGAYNARTGRRSQGCIATGTASYDAAFATMDAGRIVRPISEAQLRLATMEWTLATVQRDGRVSGKDGWVYGDDLDDGSQDTLLRYERKRVWVGTDPLDRAKPALVWNPATDRLILDGVHAVMRGKFDDAEGARRSARRRSHVRKLTKRVEDIDAAAAIVAISGLYTEHLELKAVPPSTVLAPNFKQPIRPARGDGATGNIAPMPKRKSWITPEFLENEARAQGRTP